jgi:hypothetical protein
MWAKSASAILFTVFATASWADTTPNLITNQWNGISVSGDLGGQHPISVLGPTTSFGSGPFLDNSTGSPNGQSGQIIWSYGQATVSQIIAVNQALSGSGIQISGYNWGYEVRNMNGNNGQSSYSDVLTATTFLTNSVGTRILSDTRTYSGASEWNWYGGAVAANTAVDLASAGSVGVEFASSDAGYWAGYYGPQVRNVSLSLNYGVDPCVANPAYSPSCPGYNNITTSGNLVPNPNHWTTNGASINNTYAINSALGLAGSSVRIHGFDYGYQYNLGNSYTQCTAFNQDGSCSWTMTFTPRVTVNFSVKDSSGNVLHSQQYNHSGSNTGNQSRSYQYRFGTSQDLLNLGAIGFTGTTTGNSTLFGMTSRAVYTNDSCASDPLISPSCPGYAAAYLNQQCTANPLYDSSCPGYAAAYFTQQCTADPLYASTCPGYAAAYLSQQCNINALYDSSCPGYQQAYFDQQCGIDPLYNNQCPGYQVAYFDQQCTANALYDSACPGYAQAYYDQQCAANPLYDSGCANYDVVYAATQPAATEETTTTVIAQTDTTSSVTAASDATSTTSTTSPTSVSPAAVVSAVRPAPAPAAPAPSGRAQSAESARQETKAAEQKSEQKKTDRAVARAVPRGATGRAAAQAAAERADEAIADAATATTIEAQQAAQSLVLGLMGFNPAFSAYQNAIVPDVNAAVMARQYNQPTVDNRSALRQLSGASDRMHQDMVDQQYGRMP